MTNAEYVAMYNRNVLTQPPGRQTSTMTGRDASGNPYQYTTDSGDPETARRNRADEAFRAQRYSDAQRALAQLSAPGGGDVTDVQVPTYGGDGGDGYDAFDTATRTASKENRGLALQGGLKALASQMNARGIGGGGSEAAGISRLVGMSQLGGEETERQILGGRAERQTHANDLTFQARTQAALQNANARNASASQRLQALLSLYGMSY